MKASHLYAILAISLLAGCSKPTPVGQISNGQPIMPVRIQSDNNILYFTDYVPSLMGQEINGLKWMVSENLNTPACEASNLLPDSIAITCNSNEFGILQISDNKSSIQIPVLPNLPYMPGLITTGYKGKDINLQFIDDTENAKLYAFIQNQLQPAECMVANEDGSYTFHIATSLKGRSFLRIFAVDDNYLYNDVLIPLENGKPVANANKLNRHDDQAQVLYSLMIDRFENGNKENDWKINSEEVLDVVDYQGGDFAGITKKINEGWFNNLGITTIWISPITQNPWTAWGCYPFEQKADGSYDNKFDSTRPYTRFSGYHGYWPIYVTALEKRFGTDQEFRTMLSAAHKHGLNVVLDYVANHMHVESPTLQEHPDWHTDSILPDGRRNFELWDEARLTTWFDKHIPTLDLEREEVCQPMTDSALFWLENYDLDGFRHDACKHIPLNYWRMLGQKMAKRFPNRHIWMIGETYGNSQLIGSYVKTGMLPAQFDFNIYHTAIDILGKENVSMRKLGNTIEESLAAYGAHHTMGNISGNHDKCRFISLAGGAVSWDENDKKAGWTRQVGVTNGNDPEREEKAYKAAFLLEVINLTIPGVPCIYQGDEFAAAGANDPDNRQIMQFDGYSDRQQSFRNEIQQLIQYRRQSMPLMYGEYIPVQTSDSKLVFDRIYLGKTVRVEIDKDNLTYSITEL